LEPKPFVLGAQMAAAAAMERARLASGLPGPSPLSGKAYDPERHEFDLSDVVHAPLDIEVEHLVRAWRESGADGRAVLRRSLSLEDNYTLIQFAKRVAVRALNQSSSEPCEHGLLALAMIDESRIDPRDASWAAGLLNHAAGRNRSAILFERAIALATPGMGELLRQGRDSTLEDWGYCELKTSTGIGLVQCGSSRYNPSVDLAAVAGRVGARVLSSRYVFEIEVTTELPAIWFDKGGRKHAEEVLEQSLGVALIRGTLRRGFGNTAGQMFLTWIVELPSRDDCAQLVADVGNGSAHEGRYVVGVSAGRLFALCVAGSFQQGVEPYESRAALTELAERTRAELSDSAAAAT
jgi:hypothetical protein